VKCIREKGKQLQKSACGCRARRQSVAKNISARLDIQN